MRFSNEAFTFSLQSHTQNDKAYRCIMSPVIRDKEALEVVPCGNIC